MSRLLQMLKKQKLNNLEEYFIQEISILQSYLNRQVVENTIFPFSILPDYALNMLSTFEDNKFYSKIRNKIKILYLQLNYLENNEPSSTELDCLKKLIRKKQQVFYVCKIKLQLLDFEDLKVQIRLFKQQIRNDNIQRCQKKYQLTKDNDDEMNSSKLSLHKIQINQSQLFIKIETKGQSFLSKQNFLNNKLIQDYYNFFNRTECQKSIKNHLLNQKKDFLKVYNSKQSLFMFPQSKKQKIINIIKAQNNLELAKEIRKQNTKRNLQNIVDRIIGGGQCCSRETHLDDQIINDQLQNVISAPIQDPKLNQGFQNNYNMYIKDLQHKIGIVKDTDEENEIGNIISKCLNKYKELIPVSNKVYRIYVIEIFDAILQYMVSGAIHIDNVQYGSIVKKINLLLDYIQQYKNQHSCSDFLFFSELLSDLNQLPFYEDSINREKLKICAQFAATMIKNGVSISNQHKQSLSQTLIEAKDLIQPIKSYAFDKIDKLEYVWEIVDRVHESVKSLTKDVFFRQITGLWALRIEKFGRSEDSRHLIEDEILFYIEQFIEFTNKQSSSHLILYILVQINYLFEKRIINYSADTAYQLKTELSSKISIKNIQVKQFIMMLQQRSVKTEHFLKFFSFSVRDITYRFLSNKILLNYYTTISVLDEDEQEKELFWIHLVYSYVTEKNESVKVIFQTNQNFITKIRKDNNEQIAKKVILYQQSRKEEFLNNKISSLELEEQESLITDEQDFLDKISLSLIEKWELEAQQRLDKDIALKDDVLLEVQDLYIDQNLIYLQGNNIFESNLPNDFKNKPIKSYNAIESIIEGFLIPNYCWDVPTKIQEKQFSKQQEYYQKCTILSILAEGGTGKSMLVKKLETILMKDKNFILKRYQKQINYIPFLIKCNNLDSKNPSIENYLKSQDLNEKQIKQLKNIAKFKIILLDGYDEYTGDPFRVYTKLKLNEWKNTLVIISSRLEKLTLSDVSAYFSKDDEQGRRDELSYCAVQLKEFQRKDIDQYCQKFFTKHASKQQKEENKDYSKIMQECLKNKQLEQLLFLPINLYLFTRMMTTKNEQDLMDLIHNISDQIQIQEIFFQEQFYREAVEFTNSQLPQNKQSKQVMKEISTAYFVYFQTISMQMFLNKSVKSNFLQLERKKIKFELQDSVQKLLDKEFQQKLNNKITNYVNSKIITRVKENKNFTDQNEVDDIKNNQIIEFKHKSLFEYFVARAMKFDFDIHDSNILNLDVSYLQKFSINSKIIMSPGTNQSEQQILLKLYKILQSDIDSNNFKESYYQTDIKQNNKYIQYLKRSSINKLSEISQIDVGSSNLLSALFISKFSFPNLTFEKCSFSKAYIPFKKCNTINFNSCNLNYSYLKNANLLSFETSLTNYAMIDSFQKEFDSDNIYSFNGISFYENILISITKTGFINSFAVSDQGYQQLFSKKITSQVLQTVYVLETKILVSTNYSLFEINPKTLEIDFSYKLSSQILNISVYKEKYIIELLDQQFYFGNIQNGFQQLQLTGKNPILSNKYIVVYETNAMLIYSIDTNFSQKNQIYCQEYYFGKFNMDGNIMITVNIGLIQIWNPDKDFELVNSIQCHRDLINSATFSDDGQYLITGSSDTTCSIWNIDNGLQLIQTIQGHSSSILSVALSTDQKFLATQSYDAVCNIWNAEQNFELINTIIGHTDSINAVAFSIDNKYLVTGSTDRSYRIWNVENNFQLIKTIQGHSDSINSVAFSLDGKYLVTGSSDKSCKIWNNKKNFELMKEIQGHSASINSVAFSTNGKYLATGSSDSTCKIWDINLDFELFKTISSHTSSIQQIAFSQNGKYLATGSQDKTCKIWNVEYDFILAKSIQIHTDSIGSVTFSKDSKYLATGSSDKTCKIWDTEQGFELIYTLQGHTNSILSLIFSADGKYFTTSSSDSTCKIWNAEKGFELINTIQGHTFSVNSISISSDGKYLATGSEDSTWKIWNAQTGFELINIFQGHVSSINSVSFSKDGKYLATGSSDSSCKIWNTQKGFDLIQSIQDHTDMINSVAFSADGQYLATGSSDTTCKIWNIQKGFQLICTIQGHIESIKSVAFSTDSKYLATGSTDTTFKIWNAQNNFDLIQSIQAHSQSINSVSFSTSGNYVATGSSDTTCNIWNTQKHFELVHQILGHTSSINSVGFSAKDKYLATGSLDKTCKIWNVMKGFELINLIQGHTSSIIQITFSANGKYLSTSSYDATCKIWNTEKDFEIINTIKGHTFSINSVAFSEDDKYLATGSYDKTCKIWNLEKGFQVKDLMKFNKDNSQQQKFQDLQLMEQMQIQDLESKNQLVFQSKNQQKQFDQLFTI